MRLTYKVTLDDCKAAEKLHISRRVGRRIGYGFVYIGIPVLAVLGFIGFYVFRVGMKSDLSLGYSIIEVILISQAVFIPIERSKRLRRAMGVDTATGQLAPQRTIEIDKDRILSEIPGVAKTELRWSTIREAAQNETVTMLYLNDKDFILIPTRAFNRSERKEFLDLVTYNITSSKTC